VSGPTRPCLRVVAGSRFIAVDVADVLCDGGVGRDLLQGATDGAFVNWLDFDRSAQRAIRCLAR